MSCTLLDKSAHFVPKIHLKVIQCCLNTNFYCLYIPDNDRGKRNSFFQWFPVDLQRFLLKIMHYIPLKWILITISNFMSICSCVYFTHLRSPLHKYLKRAYQRISLKRGPLFGIYRTMKHSPHSFLLSIESHNASIFHYVWSSRGSSVHKKLFKLNWSNILAAQEISKQCVLHLKQMLYFAKW